MSEVVQVVHVLASEGESTGSNGVSSMRMASVHLRSMGNMVEYALLVCCFQLKREVFDHVQIDNGKPPAKVRSAAICKWCQKRPVVVKSAYVQITKIQCLLPNYIIVQSISKNLNVHQLTT